MKKYSKDDIFFLIGGAKEESNVKVIIEELQNVNESDENGLTYLHSAVLADKAILVRVLLEKGAYPNCIDKKGNTPLSYAIGRKLMNTAQIVQLLISYGADLDFKLGEYTIRETIKMFEDPDLMKFIE